MYIHVCEMSYLNNIASWLSARHKYCKFLTRIGLRGKSGEILGEIYSAALCKNKILVTYSTVLHIQGPLERNNNWFCCCHCRFLEYKQNVSKFYYQLIT